MRNHFENTNNLDISGHNLTRPNIKIKMKIKTSNKNHDRNIIKENIKINEVTSNEKENLVYNKINSSHNPKSHVSSESNMLLGNSIVFLEPLAKFTGLSLTHNVKNPSALLHKAMFTAYPHS